ncbi:MAG: MaoC family dehydratase [Alphaproteobacteria bacterium]|nr:MaoC family dehydratase [Alphaproteobacteria bacterium]MDE2492953.1 MaoC family dehydratase [Alphaproteobacteria bacterium]
MWFEDVAIGHRLALGEYTFAEDAMIAFARKYDPQLFHIDPEAAKQSVFGGLIASGWMTVAVWMKLMTAHRAHEESGLAISPGFENLRWQKPVRPGTTLLYSTEVTGKTELKSRPRFGLVLSRSEARDRDGALYMSMTTKVLRAKKGAAS